MLSRFKQKEIAFELRNEDNKFNPTVKPKQACNSCNFWRGKCCSKYKCNK